MVSVIRVKKDGAWVGPFGDGTVRVKKDGAWAGAAKISAKLPGGSWVDTGYSGAPNPPQSLRMTGWTFTAATVGWDAPAAGGGPVASYEVEMRDSGGVNVLERKTGITSMSTDNFTVAEDYQVAFFVRAKGPTGLYSAWAQGWNLGDGRLSSRALIGHTETGYYANENRTRAWQSGVIGGAYNKDQNITVGIPSSVVLTGMHWRNLRTPQSSVVVRSGTRDVWWIYYDSLWSSLFDSYGTVYSGDNTDQGFNNQGDGRGWGIRPVGTGWSTSGNAQYQLHVDSFWCTGTETYQVSVYYVSRSYKDNSYW